MRSTDHTVDTLNSLLRGEFSAAETYRQALEKVGEDNGAAELRRIHQEHVQAANTLRQHVHQKGGEPEQDSGGWGTFAKAVEGTAKIFGNSAALKALQAGEQRGIRGYEKALEDTELPADCLILIRSNLLPQARAHIPVLDSLLDAR
jgi:uncharacterized protein (TIGR02284 family)